MEGLSGRIGIKSLRIHRINGKTIIINQKAVKSAAFWFIFLCCISIGRYDRLALEYTVFSWFYATGCRQSRSYRL